MAGAEPGEVSEHAKQRQRDEMGTLGSGNHYLEVQRVARDLRRRDRSAPSASPRATSSSASTAARAASAIRSAPSSCSEMVITARGARHRAARPRARLRADPLVDRGSAISARCARRSTARWRTARSSRTSSRGVFAEVLAARRGCGCSTTCRTTPARSRSTSSTAARGTLYVHRKGATRAFGPGHPDLPEALRDVGQPVLIGGTMGTASYVLAGTARAMERAFGSACHGAGRAMSRHAGAPSLERPRAGRRARAAAGSSFAAARCAAWPRKRPAPTRTSPRSSTPRRSPASRARWRGSSRSSASRGDAFVRGEARSYRRAPICRNP